MTYRGHVEGGVIVLDSPKKPPEGAIVRIELAEKAVRSRRRNSLSAMLLRHAGKGRRLPRDLARNHDHYLHGAPRK